jgi:hypothetical protein
MRIRWSAALTVLFLMFAAACASNSPNIGGGDGDNASSSDDTGRASTSSSGTKTTIVTTGTSTLADGGVVTTTSTSTGTGTGGSSSGASSASTGDSGSSSSSAGEGGVCDPTASVTNYPALPGAVKSTLYTVTANGTSEFVEQLTKFAPEMEVHYAHFSLGSGCATATVAVTLSQSFSSYTVSPKSRNLTATKSGNTITFTSGPNYLILKFDSQALLFVLIDAAESNPPQLGDANVKNIADYGVDNTGATLMTSKIQSAINAASGATQNILYFPPGKYEVGELWLKSNMTLYLAGGSILYGSSNASDFNTGTGGLVVENDTHGMIHLLNCTNTNILGRGVIDGNGAEVRNPGHASGNTGATGASLINLVKIDGSSSILIDGIVARDSSFWNTLIYKSDKVTIQNYKVINQRPVTTTYNQTDGVDFDSSTNGLLSNAFLYTGDDNMAVKDELDANMNLNGVVHQHVVLYSNSGGCKIGTKTGGTVMDGIVFNDIDVVKAGRAMAVDGYDTAVIQNTIWENVRVEAADSLLIDIEENTPPTWRTAANTTITKNSTFMDVTSAVAQPIHLLGRSSTINVNGVKFVGLNVQGKAVTSQTSEFTVQDAINITFQ